MDGSLLGTTSRDASAGNPGEQSRQSSIIFLFQLQMDILGITHKSCVWPWLRSAKQPFSWGFKITEFAVFPISDPHIADCKQSAPGQLREVAPRSVEWLKITFSLKKDYQILKILWVRWCPVLGRTQFTILRRKCPEKNWDGDRVQSSTGNPELHVCAPN